MADVTIKASEGFINLPDLETNIGDQSFVVNNTAWFGQVFLAESSSIQRLFFMADQTSGLKVSLYKATPTGTGTDQQFDLDINSPIISWEHTVSTNPFNQVDLGDIQDATEGTWFYPTISTPPTLDVGEYYVIVFSTTSASESQKIFFTLDYRQGVFPQITGSLDAGSSWSNDNIQTVTANDFQAGAIVLGIIGDELNDTSSFLDSGSNTVGGRTTGRRGYPVFLFVENTSPNNNSITINFSQLPPDAPTDGTSEETDQALMRWYFVEAGVFPVSGDLTPLLFKTNMQPQLDINADFVIFMQPDRLSPLATPYFPESDVNLYADPVGIVQIYESSPEFIGNNGGDEINLNFDFITDTTNRFTSDFWAHFKNRAERIETSGARDAEKSQNPSYIDFSAEKPGEDIDILKKLTVGGTLDGPENEEDVIRGFNKVAFFNGQYIFFSKKFSSSTVPSFGVNKPGQLVGYVADNNLVDFTKKTISFLDASTTVHGGVADDSYIIGVSHATVVNIQGTPTLFLLLQKNFAEATSAAAQSLSHFDIGYYQGDFSESDIQIQLLKRETTSDATDLVSGTTDATRGDGGFDPDNPAQIDDDTLAIFILPNNSDSLYISCYNNTDYSVGSLVPDERGLALWKIGLNDTLSSSYLVERVTINTIGNRGITDPELDLRISYVLKDGSTTYLGTQAQAGNLTTVYRTDDFETFEQLISADLSSPPTWLQDFDLAVENNVTKFMVKVGNILHVWTSTLDYDSGGKPFHIAVNVITKDVKVLRQFPIGRGSDRAYEAVPEISDLKDYERSKYVRFFEKGAINGNHIYLLGVDELTEETAPSTLPATYATRWLMYDDRTINDAYDQYNDPVYFSGTDIATLSEPVFVGSGVNDLEHNSIYNSVDFTKEFYIEIDTQGLLLSFSGTGSDDLSVQAASNTKSNLPDFGQSDGIQTEYGIIINKEALEVLDGALNDGGASPTGDLTLSGSPNTPSFVAAYEVEIVQTIAENGLVYIEGSGADGGDSNDDMTPSITDAAKLPSSGQVKYTVEIDGLGLKPFKNGSSSINDTGEIVLGGFNPLLIDYRIDIVQEAFNGSYFDLIVDSGGFAAEPQGGVANTASNITESFYYDIRIDSLAYEVDFTPGIGSSTVISDLDIFGDSDAGFKYGIEIDRVGMDVEFLGTGTNNLSLDYEITFSGDAGSESNFSIDTSQTQPLIIADFVIRIVGGDDTPASPNTFEFSIDGGANFETSTAIFTTATELTVSGSNNLNFTGSTGVFVQWSSLTGNQAGDTWAFQSGANASRFYKLEIDNEAYLVDYVNNISGNNDLVASGTLDDTLIYTVEIVTEGSAEVPAGATVIGLPTGSPSPPEKGNEIDLGDFDATESGTVNGLDDFALEYPTDPQDLGNSAIYSSDPDLVIQIDDTSLNIDSARPYVYVADKDIDIGGGNRGKLIVVDTNTFNGIPQNIAEIDVASISSIFVRGSYLYAVTSASPGELKIFDISDPRDVMSSDIPITDIELDDAERAVDIFVLDDKAYIVMDTENDNLNIKRVIDPDNVPPPASATDPYFIIETTIPHGLSNGDDVTIAGTSTSADGAHVGSVSVLFGNRFELTDVASTGGSITIPYDPPFSPTTFTGRITHINGSAVSVRSNTFLKILDISDPLNPVEISNTSLDGFPDRGLNLSSEPTRSDYNHYDFTNVFVKKIQVGSEIRTFAFIPNNFITAAGPEGSISILDVTDPDSVITLTPITTTGSTPVNIERPSSVYVEDNFLFVSHMPLGIGSNGSISVYDVSDPENPIFIDEATTGPDPRFVVAQKKETLIRDSSPTEKYNYIISAPARAGDGTRIYGFDSTDTPPTSTAIDQIADIKFSPTLRHNNVLFNDKIYIPSSGDGVFKIVDISEINDSAFTPAVTIFESASPNRKLIGAKDFGDVEYSSMSIQESLVESVQNNTNLNVRRLLGDNVFIPAGINPVDEVLVTAKHAGTLVTSGSPAFALGDIIYGETSGARGTIVNIPSANNYEIVDDLGFEVNDFEIGENITDGEYTHTLSSILARKNATDGGKYVIKIVDSEANFEVSKDGGSTFANSTPIGTLSNLKPTGLIVYKTNSGFSAFTDITSIIESDGPTTSIFANQYEYLVVGLDSKFERVDTFNLGTAATASQTLRFEYLTRDGWVNFSANDGTSGLTASGFFNWTINDLLNWERREINGVENKYWIRIRIMSSPSNTPTVNEIGISEAYVLANTFKTIFDPSGAPSNIYVQFGLTDASAHEDDDCWKFEVGPQGLFNYKLEIDSSFIDNVTFVGDGLDDLTLSGLPLENKRYKITIDSLADQYGYGYGQDFENNSLDYFDVLGAGQDLEDDPYGYAISYAFSIIGGWDFSAGFQNGTAATNAGFTPQVDTWVDKDITGSMALHSGSLFLGIGQEGTVGSSRLWRTTDGETWDRVANDANTNGFDFVGLVHDGSFTDESERLTNNLPANDFTIFSSNGDYLYIGCIVPFTTVTFTFATVASDEIFNPVSPDADQSVEFSLGGTSWSTFDAASVALTDNTTSATSNGTMTWDMNTILAAGWDMQDSSDVSGFERRFWIRIQRTEATVTTPPDIREVDVTIGANVNVKSHFGGDKGASDRNGVSLLSFNGSLYAGTGATGLAPIAPTNRSYADIYEWNGLLQTTTSHITWTQIAGSESRIDAQINTQGGTIGNYNSGDLTVNGSWDNETAGFPHRRVNDLIVSPFDSTKMIAALGGVGSGGSPNGYAGQVWQWDGNKGGSNWTQIGGGSEATASTAIDGSWDTFGTNKYEDAVCMASFDFGSGFVFGSGEKLVVGTGSLTEQNANVADVWVWDGTFPPDATTNWEQIASSDVTTGGINGGWQSDGDGAGDNPIRSVFALLAHNGFLYACVGSGENTGAQNNVAQVWRFDPNDGPSPGTWTKIGDNTDFGSDKQAVENITIHQGGIYVGVSNFGTASGSGSDAEVYKYIEDGVWQKIGGDGLIGSWTTQTRTAAMESAFGALFVGLAGPGSFAEAYKFIIPQTIIGNFDYGYDFGYEYGLGNLPSLDFFDTYMIEEILDIDSGSSLVLGNKIPITGKEQGINNNLNIRFGSVGETREDILYILSSDTTGGENEKFAIIQNSPHNGFNIIANEVDLGISDRELSGIVVENGLIYIADGGTTSGGGAGSTLYVYERNIENKTVNKKHEEDLGQIEPLLDPNNTGGNQVRIYRKDSSANIQDLNGAGISKIKVIDNFLFANNRHGTGGEKINQIDVSNLQNINSKRGILDIDINGSETHNEQTTTTVRWIYLEEQKTLISLGRNAKGVAGSSGHTSAIHFIDMTNPNNPSPVGFLVAFVGLGNPLNYSAGVLDTAATSVVSLGGKGIVTDDEKYLFLSYGNSLSVIDVSDPTVFDGDSGDAVFVKFDQIKFFGTYGDDGHSQAPQMTSGTISTGRNSVASTRAIPDNANKLVIFENKLFRIRWEANYTDFSTILNANQIDVVDISDPENPVFEGTITLSEIPGGGGGATNDFLADLEVSPMGFVYVLHKNESTGAGRLLMYKLSENSHNLDLVSITPTIDFANELLLEHIHTEGHSIGNYWIFDTVDTYRWTDDAENKAIVWNETNVPIKSRDGSSSHLIDNLTEATFDNTYAGGYGLGDSWAFTTVDRIRWSIDGGDSFIQDIISGIDSGRTKIPIPFQGGTIDLVDSANPDFEANSTYISFTDSENHDVADFWRFTRTVTGSPQPEVPDEYCYSAVDRDGNTIIQLTPPTQISLGSINVGPSGSETQVTIGFADTIHYSVGDRWRFTTYDSFRYTDDGNLNPISWNEDDIPITTDLIALNNNVDIRWGGKTGHDLGDAWFFSTVDTYKYEVDDPTDAQGFLVVGENQPIVLGGGTVNVGNLSTPNDPYTVAFDVFLDFPRDLRYTVGDRWEFTTTDNFTWFSFNYGYGYGFGQSFDFFDIFGAEGGPDTGEGYSLGVGYGSSLFESNANYDYSLGYEYGFGSYDSDLIVIEERVAIPSNMAFTITDGYNTMDFTFSQTVGNTKGDRWVFQTADSFTYTIDGGSPVGPILINDQPLYIENNITATFDATKISPTPSPKPPKGSVAFIGFDAGDYWEFQSIDSFTYTTNVAPELSSPIGPFAITGGTQLLYESGNPSTTDRGVSATFANTFDHRIGDQWIFEILDEYKVTQIEKDGTTSISLAAPSSPPDLTNGLPIPSSSILIGSILKDPSGTLTSDGTLAITFIKQTGYSLGDKFSFTTVDTFNWTRENTVDGLNTFTGAGDNEDNSFGDAGAGIAMCAGVYQILDPTDTSGLSQEVQTLFTSDTGHVTGDSWTFKALDTFKWGVDNGSTFIETEVIITGDSFSLVEATVPLTDITFTNIDAPAVHTLGDYWTFFPIQSSRTGFPLVEGVGVYDGKSIAIISHDETAPLWDDYPGLLPEPDETALKPRVEMYCGLVNYGGSAADGISGDNKNIPSDLVVSNGVTYLIANNDDHGLKGFKTYGIKQRPEDWGKYFLNEETTGANVTNYDFLDIDKANYLPIVGGENTFLNIARRASVNQTNGIVFVNEMKENSTSSGFENIDSTYPERSLLLLTNGFRKPQMMSFFYRINQIADGNEDLLDDILTSDTSIKFKCADTLENLFYDPEVDEEIKLAQIITGGESERVWVKKLMAQDTDNNFFRIETNSLLGNVTEDVELLVKGLRLHDVNVSGPEEGTGNKEVAINGIVQVPNAVPENILENGVDLPPDGEIIIDLVKPIYTSEISFDIEFFGPVGGADGSEFEIFVLPKFDKETLGPNLVSEDDWIAIDNPIQADLGSGNTGTITKDAIGMYIKAIRIVLNSGVTLRTSNFTLKSFTGPETQFESTGSVGSPELIVVDDIEGILSAGNTASAFATFSESDDSVTVDLGENVPVTRVSLNTYSGGNSTRTLQIDVWDGATLDGGDPVFENVYTNTVKDYEYSIVSWDPKLKDQSRNVEVIFEDENTLPAGISDTLGESLLDFNKVENYQLLQNSGIAGFSFRPNIFKDRSITISDSELVDSQEKEGLITVNMQMDEDGPFSSDIGELGLIGNNVNVDFALRQVRRIRVTLKNQGGGDPSVRMNGLKLFSPIVDEDGMAEFPRTGVIWTIRLTANILTQ